MNKDAFIAHLLVAITFATALALAVNAILTLSALVIIYRALPDTELVQIAFWLVAVNYTLSSIRRNLAGIRTMEKELKDIRQSFGGNPS